MLNEPLKRRLSGSARGLLPSMAMAAAAAALLGAAVVLDNPLQINGCLAYPISFTAGATENIAGIQFDINLDSTACSIEVEPGPAAVNAGKDVVFSMLDEDTVRVLVVGLNQDELRSGILANVYVTPGQESAAPPTLQLDGMITTDPSGNPIVPPEDDASEQDSEPSDPSDQSDQSDQSDHSSSSGDAADRSSEPVSNGTTAAASGGLMPALLDALVGDYHSPDSAVGRGDSTKPAGSGGGSRYASQGSGGTAGSAGQNTYGAPAVLSPQVYANGSSARRTTPVTRSAASAASSGAGAGAAPKVPVMPQADGAASAVRVGDPMQVSWSQPAQGVSANNGLPSAAPFEKFDVGTYLNRRSLTMAAAGAAALALMLRNALLPLVRLLKDLARF